MYLGFWDSMREKNHIVDLGFGGFSEGEKTHCGLGFGGFSEKETLWNLGFWVF